MQGGLLAEFENYEDKTGLKFPFNVFPRNKDQETKCTIPISCMYQPLRPKEEQTLIENYPMACFRCKGILNCYCLVDSKGWSCSICGNRNQFPNGTTQLPIEMTPGLLDIEYVIPQHDTGNGLGSLKPSIFVFIVDLAIDDEELEALKQSLLISIELLPANSLVSLITYGKNVNVHEIGNQNNNYFYTFNGSKEYLKDEINKKLGILKKNPKNNNVTVEISNRFVQQTSICEFNLIKLIESLDKDSFKVPKFHRKERATGCAINVAFQMLNTLYPKIGARIMLFTGGSCTIGPGSIVTTNLKDPIRSHHDLVKDSKTIKTFKNNVKFYDQIAEKASLNGHTFDIFIGCYDQIGLSEMECLVNKTGGVIVQSDSFTSAIFKQSLQKLLALNEYGESQFGLNATLEIKCHNVKINGLIGHATPLYINKSNNGRSDSPAMNKLVFHSENKVKNNKCGLSGTNVWKLGSLMTHSSYAVYFEMVDNPTNDFAIIQFITSYQHPDGTQHIHVTTSQRFINQQLDAMDAVINNFDQEAAAVLIARQAVNDVMTTSSNDALKLVNKTLVDFLSNFSTFILNSPASLSIPPNVNLLPQFIYHLRRSNFIQIFNSSPDETSFYRHCFLTEDCYNSLIMIQPTLTSYEIEKEPEAVLLDSTSIRPNRILFLDTFFHILIYHGSLIADWRRQGYQDQPGYEYFKEFLELPRQEAADILVDRFPLPRFIDTEEGGSQARFLMSKLNPTTSYNSSDSLEHLAKFGPQDSNGGADSGGAIIMTDDISLQTFMQFVSQSVVKQT